MAHPLLFILLFYVGGLITDKHVEAPIPWALSLAAIMCVTIFRSGPSSRTALPALVFLLAWCWQTTHTHTISLSDLRHRFPKPADVKLTGRIRHIDYFPSAKNTYCQIILDLESIGTNGGTQMKTGARILGDVLLTGVPFVRKHDQVQLTGILSPIRTSAYPFAFQPDIYWEARGMHHQIRIDSESMQLVSSATPETGWDRRFMDWASSHLDRELPEDQAAQLMQAMTLGKKNEIPADIHAMFARAGTIHLFAISGLHIGLITFVLIQLAALIIQRRWIRALMAIPLIWWYVVATGNQTSAIRAAIMATVLTLGWCLNRPGNLINTLSASALIILVLDPNQLYLPGFQLSFGVVFAIAEAAPAIQRLVVSIQAGNPLLPKSEKPTITRLVERAITTLLRWFVGTLLLSIVCWLGSLPFTAFHFHYFPIYSPLLNVPSILMGTLCLMSCFGSLLAAALQLDFISIAFNHGAWFWMKSLIFTGSLADRLPGATIATLAISPFLSLMAWISILRIFREVSKPGSFPTPSFWVAVLGIVLFVSHLVSWNSKPCFTLYANEAGTTILSVDGNHLLIDPGRNREAEGLLSDLRARSIQKLDALVLTHGDIAHVEATESILTHLPVQSVIKPMGPYRSSAYRTAVALFEQYGLETSPLSFVFPLETGSPSATRADDSVLCLLVELKGTQILMTGDLNREGQRQLLLRYPSLKAQILISSIDSDHLPPSMAFIEQLQPSLLLVHDSGTRMSPNIEERLATTMTELGVPFHRTSNQGSITCFIDDKARLSFTKKGADGMGRRRLVEIKR